MPYIDEERKILTKVIGIASKIDDKDDMRVRQVILDEINDDPSIVDLIYLKKREVWVKLSNGGEHYLGDIKSKYEKIIMSNATRIVSWQLTGGHDIPKGTMNLGGHDGPIGRVARAKRGMNLAIELL